jgi:tape measure domain-containing protein
MAVEIKVVANTKQAERSMDKLEKKVSGVGKGADKTSGSFDKVSKSVKKVERGSDLSKLTKNTERAADSAESLEKSFSDATRTINKLVIASTALLTTYITVKGVVTGVADQYRRINSQLRLVTRSTQQIVVANERLFKISQDTRSSFEATTNLFTRFARVSKDLGATQNQVLAVTKTVQQAIKVSGTSAQSAEAAIIQLGQGLASGTLRGEELNSVLEQAPRLASAIADGIGVSVGELRKLGAEGKITSSEVFGALLSQSKQIAGEFAQIETTFSGASQVAGNAFARFVNELDKASGFSQLLIDSTLDIGRAFEKVASRVEFNIIRIRNLFNELAFQSRLVFSSVAETFNDSEIGKQVTRAFQSLQSIDLSGIKLPTIKLDSIVSGFDVAINAIDKFYKLVSGYFYDLYMDVIGNSTYTDLIKGVTEKSQSLITNVVPKIRSFANSVSTIFKGIEQPDLAGVTPEALAALNSNVAISTAGGGDLPLALRALDTSLGILNTTLKFVSQGLRDFREAFGNNAMAGLIAGIALLNKNFRSQLTGGTGARAGGFIAGNVEATVLGRFTTQLSGEVAALEKIAGRSSGRVSDVNAALTNLAERVGQSARDTISRFNDEIRETGVVTATTEQEMRDLAQSMNGSARAAILAEIEFRKAGLTQEQAARKSGGATARLVAEETRLKAIRESQAKATGRVRESFVSGGQQIGGALGATGGFLAGQQFIDYLEKNVGELSGWQEAGITIAASFGGQALGSALGSGVGAAAGFAFGGLIAKGIAAAGAAIAAIGSGIAVAFRASTAAFAAVGAAIGAAFRGSLVITGISSVIGTALASAFAIAVGGISLPALAIGALVVGGVSLAYYFRDAIVEAFKIAKTKVTDFFTGIFGDSSKKSQVNGGARRRASRNMATGGKVSGAGTGTSDSIPANLSNGEFVVNAAATKKHAGLLARLNGGMNPGGDGKGGYAGGGLVGDETAVLKHLRKFEGYVPHIYTDTEGFATIGIGHLLTDSDISSGRFFDPKDPLTEEYKKMSKKDLGKLFHANGLGSQYRKPSVQLNDGEANSMALADYGRNLGHLLSKDVFREAYAKAPFYAQGVLGDLAFNLGANLDNSFPGFTRGMAAGDYPHAAGQLRDSRYYYQTGRRAIANVNQLGQGEVDPVGIKRQSRVSNLFGYALNSGYSKNLMKALDLDENQGGLFQASNPGNLISDVLAKSLDGSSRLALETAGYMKPNTEENKENKEDKENKEAKPEEQGFFSRLGSFLSDTNRMMMPMGFATGGSVNGPGTGTSDSIPARLSNGEFVVNAKATQQNRALLEQINSGAVMGLKDGGSINEPGSDSIPARLSNGEFLVNAKAAQQNRDLLEQINSGAVMGFKDGGSVNRPGSDSMPARLSNGEFLVNAKATQQNRTLLEQINSGAVMGLKDGGSVNGPGSGTSDSIPARLSNGEFIVNAKATQQNRDLLEQINSGAVMGFKDGGPVGGRQQRVLGGLNRQGFDTTNMEKINDDQLTQLVDFSRILSSVDDRIDAQLANNMEVAAADYALQQQIAEKIGGILNSNDPTAKVPEEPDPGVTDPMGALGLGGDRKEKGSIGKGADAAGIDTEGVLSNFESVYSTIDKLAAGSAVSQQDSFQAVGDGLMGLLGENAKYSESSFKAQQALSIGQAMMNTGTAVTAALAEGGPFAGPALAAIALASGMAQVSAIKSQKFQKPAYATGGYVSGPGTGTSDSISAQLSNGEFVMNQKATAANRKTLESMNSGQSVQQGGGYIANQTVQVEVGLGRNSQATADAAGSSVINAINQGNADGRRSRRRAR